MIFLTVGTQEPFERLVRAVDDWAERNPDVSVFGQITEGSRYTPKNFQHVSAVPPREFRDYCERAKLIVSHAGMGSIIMAMTYRRPILILPRRHDLREHRSDHQVATARRFADRPGIEVASSEADLGPMIDAILSDGAETGTVRPFAEDRLIAALRKTIFSD